MNGIKKELSIHLQREVSMAETLVFLGKQIVGAEFKEYVSGFKSFSKESKASKSRNSTQQIEYINYSRDCAVKMGQGRKFPKI